MGEQLDCFAIMMPITLAQYEEADVNGDLRAHFTADEINVAISFSDKEPFKYRTCLLVNCGDKLISYEQTVTTVDRPEPKYTLMSASIHKVNAKPGTFDGLRNQSNFQALVHDVVGRDNLYSAMKPVPTMVRKQQWQGQDTETQLGWIHVLNKRVDDVKKRSGGKGLVINLKGYDDSTQVIPMPRAADLAAARAAAERLGNLALGVVTTAMGWAVRLPKGEDLRLEAKALLDPDVAKTVGANLMAMNTDSGSHYIAKFVPDDVTFIQLTELLQRTFGWETRPAKQLNNSKKGTKHMKVFAAVPPPEGAKLQIRGCQWLVDIVPFKEPSKQTAAKQVVQRYYVEHPEKVQEAHQQYAGGSDSDDDFTSPATAPKQEGGDTGAMEVDGGSEVDPFDPSFSSEGWPQLPLQQTSAPTNGSSPAAGHKWNRARASAAKWADTDDDFSSFEQWAARDTETAAELVRARAKARKEREQNAKDDAERKAREQDAKDDRIREENAAAEALEKEREELRRAFQAKMDGLDAQMESKIAAVNAANDDAASDGRRMQLRIDAIQTQLDTFISEARAMALKSAATAQAAVDVAQATNDSIKALTVQFQAVVDQVTMLTGKAGIKDAEVSILSDRIAGGKESPRHKKPALDPSAGSAISPS